MPFGPVTTRPAKASMLYLRKQPLHGLIMRRWEALPVCCRHPSLQLLRYFERNSRHAIRQAVDRIGAAFASGKTNPLWAVNDPARPTANDQVHHRLPQIEPIAFPERQVVDPVDRYAVRDVIGGELAVEALQVGAQVGEEVNLAAIRIALLVCAL